MNDSQQADANQSRHGGPSEYSIGPRYLLALDAFPLLLTDTRVCGWLHTRMHDHDHVGPSDHVCYSTLRLGGSVALADMIYTYWV